MALLNIGASNRDDAFYRYKMPRLQTKIEGRGNGIKTNVVNMVDVAKALARNPAYTTKYFGCELGAQSKFDEKTGTSIVNGAHDTAKLAGLLENFIKKYVQCYGCGNPETDINITKTQLINLKCQACGFVSEVDMRDKLTTYILKNPPEQKKAGKKEKGLRKAEKERLDQGELADEEAKKLKNLRKKKGTDDDKKPTKKKANGNGSDEELSPVASLVDEGEDLSVDDDEVEWQTDTSAEAAKQRIQEQLSTATSEMVMLSIPEKSQTSPRVKTPRTPKEKEVKPKLLKKLSSKKVEPPPEVIDETKVLESPKVEELSPHEKLVKDFKECLQKGSTAAQLAAHFQAKEESQQEVLSAYFEALFGGVSKGLSKEIAKKKEFLAKAVQDDAQQKIFLDVLESHCTSHGTDLGNEVAVLLKVLYDEDILDEDHIIEWFDTGASKPRGAQVRKSAHPFVTWLRSAEAETEEED